MQAVTHDDVALRAQNGETLVGLPTQVGNLRRLRRIMTEPSLGQWLVARAGHQLDCEPAERLRGGSARHKERHPGCLRVALQLSHIAWSRSSPPLARPPSVN